MVARIFLKYAPSLALAALSLGLGTRESSAARAEAKRPLATGEIRLTARVPGSGGRVICALFRESGWLKKPVSTVKSEIHGHQATCVFTGVEIGTYAIVAFHDQNDSGSIDKNFLGIPTEDWCTSRNAKAIFGPPSFAAAKFSVRVGVVRLACSM